MKIFILGLLLNITSEFLNIPLGPERYIKRLYKSAYSLINIEFDDMTRKIADTIIYIAVSIYVFLIVWTFSEIHNIIPLRFCREIICSFLVCLIIRVGQNDNLRIICMLKKNKRDAAIKILHKRGLLHDKTNTDISNSDICRALLRSRGLTVRMLVCPIFFYMCFGIIAAFLYKTAEILSRTENNRAAKIVYRIMSFIPALVFRVLLRLSCLIFKGRVPSGNSVYKLIGSYLGADIEKNTVTFKDVLKTECVIYLSLVLFGALSYTIPLLADFIKTYI